MISLCGRPIHPVIIFITKHVWYSICPRMPNILVNKHDCPPTTTSHASLSWISGRIPVPPVVVNIFVLFVLKLSFSIIVHNEDCVMTRTTPMDSMTSFISNYVHTSSTFPSYQHNSTLYSKNFRDQ